MVVVCQHWHASDIHDHSVSPTRFLQGFVVIVAAKSEFALEMYRFLIFMQPQIMQKFHDCVYLFILFFVEILW